LFQNSALLASREIFNTEVENLLKHGLLIADQGFILCADAGKQHISKRLNGNRGAEQIMPTAYRYSKKIARFPFVEGVYLSGALSKKYFDEKGDIDYFIVTTPHRLWICRTLLILQYKLLRPGKKKFWCVNYFISSDNLAIEDQNVFTSTELAHLIPAVNYEIYSQLLQANKWYRRNLPNKLSASSELCADTPRPFYKRLLELAFFGKFGTMVDNFLLTLTLKHWQKKFPDLSKSDFELQFRSRRNVCKRHTTGYQNKVLKQWEQKQDNYEKLFNISLKKETILRSVTD
ncbi:MAG TPA: hypothetical protein VEB42_14045, partial [Chitinophagaceae bacterium]|nr:hypothetical protein [Chitinophagaceae bacterium]